MSLTWSQVSSWSTDELDSAERYLRDMQEKLTDAGLDLNEPFETWQGEASSGARVQQLALREALEDRVSEIAAVRQGLRDFSDAVRGVQGLVTDALTYASSKGLSIRTDGTVVDHQGLLLPVPATHDSDLIREDRERVVEECVALVEEALRRADYTDQAFLGKLQSTVLNGWLAGQDASSFKNADDRGREAGDLGPYRPPVDSASEAQNAAWWKSLTEDEQESILRQHPEWLGNRDGLPADVRDRANRRRLPMLQAENDQVIDRLMRDHGVTDPRLLSVFPDMKKAIEVRDSLTALSKVDTNHQIIGIQAGERFDHVQATRTSLHWGIHTVPSPPDSPCSKPRAWMPQSFSARLVSARPTPGTSRSLPTCCPTRRRTATGPPSQVSSGVIQTGIQTSRSWRPARRQTRTGSHCPGRTGTASTR
ncbi:hypothetical protein JCM9957A_11810 [Kineosporia succinea]|uniref:WXG100 family type VII secretion target n=1 Tax=Kineosporia succinea TaxID=84632 RepID=A0ABT9P7C0_9ACTN|nr:hypothetical protein [Kineosporia succinea]MDP9828451.1 hypothetical protein [Kineosporia succinea]